MKKALYYCIILFEVKKLARSEQKLKIIYLMDILRQNSDENNPISMDEIIKRLSLKGVKAERKSIYDDINTLNFYGLDIRYVKKKGYYIAFRDFEVAELKLLIDAVQASKFLTEKKSDELIKKLEAFSSKYTQEELRHSVVIRERIKTMNESVFASVDVIQQAINTNCQIKFKYFEWNTKKERVFRKNGERYTVSPLALVWDDENYYLVAFDSAANQKKHFRVDKMMMITIFDKKREGVDAFKRFDTAQYSKKMFGMFGGELTRVSLECDNSLVGVMLDRFGTNLIITPKEETFVINVEVAQSKAFLSWIMQFGAKVKILSPESVADELKMLAKEILENY